VNVASLTFIAFVIPFAVLHALIKDARWRSGVFLIANVLFILSFTRSPLALLPAGVFLTLGYLCVRLAQVVGRSAFVAFIAGTLLLFVYLKKYWFLSFLPVLPFTYLTVGLSYAFFRIMGMIIDARDDQAIAKVGPIAYFNFAVNFPTMVAGPIDRYQEFSQPAEPMTVTLVGQGLERIVWGFFKIFALSALVLQPQSQATALLAAGAATNPALSAMVSIGLYPIYLYFNFAGYTDIVIGAGYLFGKRYPENFNAPFSAQNFIDFWSRWHMSLSFWLRDYVYAPLLKALMSRSASKQWDIALGAVTYFVTFFLIGLWHGSTVTFAIYGLLLGLGVSVNKLYQVYMPKIMGRQEYRSLGKNRLYQYVARGLTYAWFAFCMIFFWSTISQEMKFGSALSLADAALAAVAIVITASILLGLWTDATTFIENRLAARGPSAAAPYLRAAVVGGLIFACVATEVLISNVNSNIIYQAF
jgi:D-alanyl-lipoteichoic acid acyltransferase DltB (MBOAT superfamily)